MTGKTTTGFWKSRIEANRLGGNPALRGPGPGGRAFNFRIWHARLGAKAGAAIGRNGFLMAILLAAFPSSAATNLSAWAFPGPGGRVICQPDALGNRIPDYSSAGYRGGTVPLPDVPVKITISPVPGDNGANIQNAINQLKTNALDANGFRGAILLTAGEYPISNSITINTNGIVLRGVGDGTNGTVLRATGTNQRTLIIITNAGSASTVSSTTRYITNRYVPVGARSFNVDSTANLAVGDRVFVRRIATTNWIRDLGMDQLDYPWLTNSYNIDFDRVITRIEGSRITIDAPITTAIESQYGGGTIRRYTWPARLANVGIEYLRGVSDYFGSTTNETHAWTFIRFHTVSNAWVRRVTSQYFGYACVFFEAGTLFATAVDCQALDPISIITGERRYAFAMNDCQLCLVQNCYTRQDRHQFVTHSVTTGPNIFVDGVSDTAYNDAGPHHRWGNGAIWDNIIVNGNNLNVQNRGNSGTGHGWAGANEVVWNCKASGFIVQNPPTARNWLIGSVGPIQEGTMYVGPHDPGTYDSHGTNVFPNSLYYAQLQDRLAAPNLQTREYWVGEINQFTNSAPPGERVPLDTTWSNAVQAAAGGGLLDGFDVVISNQWVPFTFNFALATNERVVAATLSLALRAVADATTNKVLYLDDLTNGLGFSSLGWLPVATGTNTSVRVLDFFDRLALLTDGKLNVAVQNDVGIDWAMLELQVAPVVTVFTNALLPVADAFARGGTYATNNFGTNTTLTLKEDSADSNDRKAYLRWDLGGVPGNVLQAKVRLTPVTVNTNGIEHGAALANTNGWTESFITWSNQPGGGRRFVTWIPAVNVPVEFVVTPQVSAALAGDKQLSLQLFSIRDVGAAGYVDYAAREHSDPVSRPQLLLVISNTGPTISAITNRIVDEDTSTGPIAFTVGDAESPADALTVSATSSNTNLVSTANMVLDGNGANRTLTVLPATNQNGSAVISMIVTDPGGLTASTGFTLTVSAVNDPPVLQPVSDQVVNAGITLTITNVAADLDVPPQALTFGLLSAPTGANLNTNSGVFTWRPTIAQANTTNLVVVNVTDNGFPPLSAAQSFAVVVNPIAAPVLTVAGLSGGSLVLNINGPFGPDYLVQTSTDLTNWPTLFTTNSPLLPFNWIDPDTAAFPVRFYRIRLAP